MPTLQGVKAEIFVDNKSATEYSDPDIRDGSAKAVRYIEVAAGQEFYIDVTWPQGFKMLGAKSISFHVETDHTANTQSRFLKISGSLARHGALSKDTSIRFDGFLTKNVSTGLFESQRFRFGRMVLSDDSNLNTKLNSDQCSKIGSIRITAFPANLQPTIRPNDGFPEHLDAENQFHEKIVKGRDLDAVVQFSDPIPATNTIYPGLCVRHPPGQDRDLNFVFLYRNRMQLQNLGHIARTPTPPPTLEQQAQEIQQLRREKERVAKELKTLKQEINSGSTRSRVSSQQITNSHSSEVNVKRENEVEEILGSARPIKRKRIMMDLTEDSD